MIDFIFMNFRNVGQDCQSGRKPGLRRGEDGGTRLSRPIIGNSCPAAGGTNFNRVSIILCFLALSCVLGKASGETNNDVSVSQPSAVDGKNPDAGVILRDPFWPVGYVPPAVAGRESLSARNSGTESGNPNKIPVSDLTAMLKIGGVVRKGGRFYATINGFTVQTGEVVTAVSGGNIYQFIVEKIDLKKVQVKLLKR